METDLKLLIVLLAMGVTIWQINAWQKRKEEEQAASIGSVKGMDTDSEDVIKSIPNSDLAINQKKLAAYPLIPIANALHDAGSIINTDEDMMFVALKSIPNKLVLQALANYFVGIYKVSLSNFLSGNLDTDELATAYKILNKLPNDFTHLKP